MGSCAVTKCSGGQAGDAAPLQSRVFYVPASWRARTYCNELKQVKGYLSEKLTNLSFSFHGGHFRIMGI